MSTTKIPPVGEKWAALDRWLRSSDAHWFVDDAVLGGLPVYAVDEALEDYGITATPENRRQVGYLVDAAIREGVA